MADDPSPTDTVDALLDRWEALVESGVALDVDGFLAEFGVPFDHPSADDFRRRVGNLRKSADFDPSISGNLSPGLSGDLIANRPVPFSDPSSLPIEPFPLAPRMPGWTLTVGAEPIPGYRLVKELGRGGYGVVWQATGPGERKLALKFVDLNRRAGETERRALETIRNVVHPRLLAIDNAWEFGERLVVSVELADGTLWDRFLIARREGGHGIPREELLLYMAQAAEGIDYLNHPIADVRPGIMHRDISPRNLFLVAGEVKVGDFGLVRILESDRTGHTGAMTMLYAAPEFFLEKTERHSDQYSLAMVYCELRGGELPFKGDSRFEIMEARVRGEPDLSTLPTEERPIVRRALARNSQDRWPSCTAFIDALSSVEATEIQRPFRKTLYGVPEISTLSNHSHEASSLNCDDEYAAAPPESIPPEPIGRPTLGGSSEFGSSEYPASEEPSSGSGSLEAPAVEGLPARKGSSRQRRMVRPIGPWIAAWTAVLTAALLLWLIPPWARHETVRPDPRPPLLLVGRFSGRLPAAAGAATFEEAFRRALVARLAEGGSAVAAPPDFPTETAADPVAAVQWARPRGAARVVIGSIDYRPERVHVEGRLLDVGGHGILKIAAADGPSDDPYTLAASLAERLRDIPDPTP